MVQAANILVGGGTGFVGRHLVNCLKTSGAKVRIITRKPASGNSTEHITWARIRDEGLPKDTTAVVNVAGRNILDPTLWTETFKQEIYDSRVGTNRLLTEAIHKAAVKPKAFVTISGVGFYKPSDDVEYNEDDAQPSEASKRDYLMNLARDWEQASLLDEQLAPNTRRVVIRSGVVIGKDGGIIKQVKLPFSLGLGGPLGNGKQWFPWIHVDDLANMFKFAITNEHVSGAINGVAPEQVTNKEFALTLGKTLNRPAFVPMPSFIVNILFGADRANIVLNGQRVKSRAGLLGFRYEYPTLADACRECVC